tara:strand:+ start:772 stop:918 length:147 start_codon:yes stop_codon:yes gene_type:complete
MTTKQELILEAVNECANINGEYYAEIFENGMHEMELINERLRIIEKFS